MLFDYITSKADIFSADVIRDVDTEVQYLELFILHAFRLSGKLQFLEPIQMMLQIR